MWIDRFNIVKMSPQKSDIFNATTPIKITTAFFRNLYGKANDLEQPKQSHKRAESVHFRLLDFKRYHKATVIKISWNWHEERQIDQCNSRESRLDPFIYHQLNFDQVNSTGKGKSFQQIVLEQLDIYMGKMKSQPLSHLIPKKKN